MKTYFRIFSFIALIFSINTGFAKEVNRRQPTVAIYGAEAGKAGDPRCRDDQGQCLILQGAPIVLKDYSYETHPKDKPEITFSVEDASAKQLSVLSQKYLGRKLAVVIGDAIIAAPTVRAVTASNGFIVSFCDQKDFNAVKSALAGQAGAIDRLKALKRSGC